MKLNPSLTQSYKHGLYGLPFTREYARLVMLPVPWEVTTSYQGGCAQGPEAILKASPQVDLFDPTFGNTYENGFFLEEVNEELAAKNNQLRPMAKQIINEWEEWGKLTERSAEHLKIINLGCEEMVNWVYQESQKILEENKFLGIVGGDHSSPLGAIKALSEKHQGDYGILHIDAHADLRKAYQGFTYSHASIFYNVLQLELPPKKLVQVGIRDFCQEEYEAIKENNIICFFDRDIKNQMFDNVSWKQLCQQMIKELPDNVYISLDIDGLMPTFCPHTGTPVPGGLSYDQVIYLISALAESGKKIIGFDLCEVAPSPDGEDEWDGNVGARLLFQLCNQSLITNGVKNLK